MAVAWVFPGQGAQMVGMGRELYAQVPAVREVFEQADAALDFNLTRMCFEGPEDALTATENAQPAILTVSVALLRALSLLMPEEQTGCPLVVAGHSLGEYSALVAAGALDTVTAVRLVRRRGELMAQAREGTMAAVLGLECAVLDAICQQASQETGQPVVIANHNALDQLVVSGATEAVALVGAQAKERGAKRVRPLKVSAAFHSPLMQDAAHGMDAALAEIAFCDLQIPLLSNVHAQPIRQAADIRPELVAQVVSPVRWVDSVLHMAAQGVTTFVEIGPGAVLTGLIKRIVPGANLINLRDANDIRDFAAQVAV